MQYSWLAMSLGQKGEGGTIVLREILVPLLKSARKIAFVSLLSFIGISLLFGDGVITPAISILSAVEGLELIPGLEGIQAENSCHHRSNDRNCSFLVSRKKGRKKSHGHLDHSWSYGLLRLLFRVLFQLLMSPQYCWQLIHTMQ